MDMTIDSTPLIQDDQQPPTLPPHTVIVEEAGSVASTAVGTTFDEIIERCIGGGDYLGWKEFLRVILICLAWAFDAQQTFISVFTDARPTWHCNINYNITMSSCSSLLDDVCLLPEDAWSWDLPPYASTISEWSLYCSPAGSFLSGLPASSFFAGCLAGGFLLPTLADSYLGRKKLLLLSCLLMSLSSLLTALLSTNVWTYAALRFLCGCGRSSVGACALVLSTELVGKRWRSQVGMMGFFTFTLGFLSLPALAYINRGSSWRVLYLWTGLPTLIYSILLHCFACESPRWLYVRRRKQEFLDTLNTLNTHIMMTSPKLVEEINSFFDHDINVNNSSPSSTYSVLWNKSWAFRRLLAVMGIGFGSGMVYYGMPQGLGSLSSSFNDLYLSVTLNALSELPAACVTFFLIGKLSRKGLVLGFSVASGVCSCLIIMVDDHNQVLEMALELTSFFCACTAFNVLLIFTLELFPTCVRNSALSMVRQAVVFGGLFSPLLVAAAAGSSTINNRLVTYGVFGVTIAAGGVFVGCLPETKGAAFCDTLDEQEADTTVDTPLSAS